ncbi:MAG: succinyldiaminopimelate transaminase [Proteobacteria bacterium]|nr:succinyldiaminopimelate transaminase [Pseudomonadota bacterium]
MNPRLRLLAPYPFERLARLLAPYTPPRELTPIAMSIGEPQHTPPQFILEALRAGLARVDKYPLTRGLPQLRAACAQWLTRRYGLAPGSVLPENMVLPVNGTREALFAIVQAVLDSTAPAPLVAMPNPCYQIYEGAALLAGAQPHYLAAAADALPDLDSVPAQVWRRCQLLFLCSPDNPTGTVAPLAWLQRALQLARQHGFVIASDECYTELYLDGIPPPGLLQAAQLAGHTAFEHCVVFHSLSKRSSVPGLRSGFVAGDPQLIERFHLYRTYHGSAMSVPTQLASIAAWEDEGHVAANRRLYQEKFDRVLPLLSPLLPVRRPAGAFYLWPRIGADDEDFTARLYAQTHVTVLPGSYLGRPGPAGNPGAGHVRISLVPPLTACLEAAQRLRDFIRNGAAAVPLPP